MFRPTHHIFLLLACAAASPTSIKRTAPPAPPCIRRPAPPAPAVNAGTGTGATAGAAAAPKPVSDNQPNPVQEAANARIANMPRVDLLGGAGIGAFKIQGDNAKAAEGKT